MRRLLISSFHMSGNCWLKVKTYHCKHAPISLHIEDNHGPSRPTLTRKGSDSTRGLVLEYGVHSGAGGRPHGPFTLTTANTYLLVRSAGIINFAPQAFCDCGQTAWNSLFLGIERLSIDYVMRPRSYSRGLRNRKTYANANANIRSIDKLPS